MKYKKVGRKGKDNNIPGNNDKLFSKELIKKRKVEDEVDDDEIESDLSDGEDGEIGADKNGVEEGDDIEFEETQDEKRKRMATELLNKVREMAKKEKEELESSEENDSVKEGEKDSLVAQLLMQEQLEESGRVRRAIASRVQKPETIGEFRLLAKHRHSVTAVALSEDDSKGFSASKDGTIIHWDVNTGKSQKYRQPSNELLRSHGMKDPQGRATRHSKQVLSLAVSSDGRYLASGGLDCHVHLWDTRTQEHIQAFPGHRRPVSCLAFRQGTPELFSGSFDRTVQVWNAEDRTSMQTLFGHQSEILTIDCLRKERVLTVGRDRCMQLFKVHEGSRLVFRASASSLECCCFINNDEFLSGSDDGSIELWSMMKKKPVFIVRNAHPLLTATSDSGQRDKGIVCNDAFENGDHNPQTYDCSSAHSWVSSVTVCRNSDLAASGAGNGSVRLWAVESGTKDIKLLYDVPLVGFVNSLAFAKSGKFLVAGVGQEPRLGRWGSVRAAQNGIAIHALDLS